VCQQGVDTLQFLSAEQLSVIMSSCLLGGVQWMLRGAPG
jgi:hypothetical protein